MLTKRPQIVAVVAITGLLAVTAVARPAANPSQQTTPAAPALTPQSPPVAAGEAQAKKLLVLMDTDHSGKVSKQEFMQYMSAEFDRLDTNHDGALDITELEQSQMVHHGGTRR